MSSVTKEMLVKILRSEVLKISEARLFSFVVAWISEMKPSDETISELISLVRFPQMKPYELTTLVRSAPYVPSDLRLEAFEYFHNPALFRDSSEKKFQPRTATSQGSNWSTEHSKGCSINDDIASWSAAGHAVSLARLSEGTSYICDIEIISGKNFTIGVEGLDDTKKPDGIAFGFSTAPFGQRWSWGPYGIPSTSQLAPKDVVRITRDADNTLEFELNGQLVRRHPQKTSGTLRAFVYCEGAGSCKLLSIR